MLLELLYTGNWLVFVVSVSLNLQANLWFLLSLRRWVTWQAEYLDLWWLHRHHGDCRFGHAT
jgi:hypothetical protein